MSSRCVWAQTKIRPYEYIFRITKKICLIFLAYSLIYFERKAFLTITTTYIYNPSLLRNPKPLFRTSVLSKVECYSVRLQTRLMLKLWQALKSCSTCFHPMFSWSFRLCFCASSSSSSSSPCPFLQSFDEYAMKNWLLDFCSSSQTEQVKNMIHVIQIM